MRHLVYNLLVRFFDAFERVLQKVRRAIRTAWRAFADGPLQSFLFLLILVVTGVVVLVEGFLEEVDRLIAILERGFISVAMLGMVALSFLDYLRREMPGFSLEIQGGPNMAVVLMVWVGFMGASLASRQGKHLAVDATDRLLSPAAARMAKRFVALVAAGFSWKFMGYAMELVDESLANGSGQDALPLWDWLVTPVNLLGSIMLHQGPPPWLITLSSAAVLLVAVGIFRSWRRTDGPVSPWVRGALNAAGAGAVFLLAMQLIAHNWQPVGTDGAPQEWVVLENSADSVSGTAAEMEKLNSDLDDLVFADTGMDGAPDGATQGNGVEALLAGSSGGQKFPLWLAQAIIPLSFGLMAFRFLGIGLFGRIPVRDDDDEGPPAPPPKTWMAPTTGRGARDLVFAGLIPGMLLGLGAVLGVPLGWLILIAAVLLLMIGAPLFLTIGVASVACVTLIQDISGYTVAKDMYEAVKKEELLAIPFFVLAGNVMTNGSIAERLVGVARAAMGRTPGGLGLATIFACVFFAAISGSSPVTVIAVGSIMFPMLVRERYPEDYSIGVLTSAGSLGIIIPPSVPMIVYAIMVSTHEQQVSPNDLFVAGILPGLFIATVLIVYTLYQTRPTRPGIEIATPTLSGGYFANLGREIRRSLLSLVLPVIILGGIYGVLGPIRFTVTEAAAVAVVYALFVELFIHRELKLKDLPKVLSDSGVMMGSLFLIIVLAIAFNKFLSEQYIPQDAAAWLSTQIDERWQFIILVNIFLLILGCFMEIISAILIVAPLLAPIAMKFGMHPVHFGIMFIVNLELGYLTPPMGINLFVSSTVFKRPVGQVIKASLPFLLMMLFCLAVIAWFPSLSLALLD